MKQFPDTSNEPPQAVDIEKQILGAIILENEAFEEASRILRPVCFYDKRNAMIFKLMFEMYNSNLVIDVLSLYEYLKREGKAEEIGASYLSKLTNDMPSSAVVRQHSQIVYEKYVLREMIHICLDTASTCYQAHEDVFELLDTAKNKFEHLTDQIDFLQPEKNLGDELKKLFEGVRKEQIEGNKSAYETESFPSFNKAVGGHLPGEMIVFSGKDKGGKTTTGLAVMLDYFKRYQEPMAMFTYEMPFEQYAKKNISLATGTRYDYLRHPSRTNKDGSFIYDEKDIARSYGKAKAVFDNHKFFIIDEVLNDIQLASKIRYLYRKHNVKTFMIDYISLIEVAQKRERRDLDIASISRMLKRLTNELKLRIIVLSQENDEGKTAESKGLQKDCDFWFSVSKPINEDKNHITIGNNQLKADNSLFVVDFKRSRHGSSGGRFITYYMKDGTYREIDPEKYEPNVGEREEADVPDWCNN